MNNLDERAIIAIIDIGLRVLGAIVCANKAQKLNRNQTGWIIFGFLMPIVAMIWIQFIKPKIKWDKNIPLKENE